MPVKQRWLNKLNFRQPAAVILGGRTYNGLSFCRSLGRKGIPVICIDSTKWPGMRSRYALNILQPDVVDTESELLSFLKRLGDRLPTKGVLIPVNNTNVLFVSRNRASLFEYFDFVLPDHSVVECMLNKRLQYRFTSRIGIPMPETYYADTLDDIQRIADTITYPCIIKPTYSHLSGRYAQKAGWRAGEKVRFIQRRQELITSFMGISKGGMEVVIQERIGGGDDCLSHISHISRVGASQSGKSAAYLSRIPGHYGQCGC